MAEHLVSNVVRESWAKAHDFLFDRGSLLGESGVGLGSCWFRDSLVIGSDELF